jgi:PAS domain S-box-containing protein
MSHREFVSVYDMTMDQIEQRLEDIERNKIEFYAEARDGFYISTREGQFLDCNDALVNMLGYRTSEEVLCLDLNTQLWGNPDERPRFQAIIEQQGFVRDYHGTFRHKEGRVVYVSLSSHVWKDRQGQIGGYRGFVVDRTREKLMSDQLQLLETRYKNLFSSPLRNSGSHPRGILGDELL